MQFMEHLYHLHAAVAVYLWWMWRPAMGRGP